MKRMLMLLLVITLAILILNRFPVARAPMILVVNASNMDAEEEILKAVKQFEKHFKIKSRNLTETTLDMVIELRTTRGGEMVRQVMALPAVTSAALLSHDGETTF